MSKTIIVLSTCPDETTAHNIAQSLLKQKLAACVNIIAGVVSLYEWQGQIEQSQEHLLIIKTLNKIYPEIESAINKLHPYELPEIISVPINTGSEQYLAWISNNVTRKKNEV